MVAREKIVSPESSRRSHWPLSVRRFVRADQGVAAIEFGMIAVPFLGLLLAIFQTSVVLFASQVLNTATQNAARQIMTGAAQSNNLTQSQFRDLICPPAANGVRPANALPAIIDCSKLIIDVRVASSFPTADTSKAIFNNASQAQFNPGGPTTINVVRVLYQLPAYLSILGSSNNIFGISASATSSVILATAVFQTEPYGS